MRWAASVWVPSRGLSVHHLAHDPLIDSAWDAVLYAVGSFFSIGHPLGVVTNEWIEIIVAEAFVHSGGVLRGAFAEGECLEVVCSPCANAMGEKRRRPV